MTVKVEIIQDPNTGRPRQVQTWFTEDSQSPGGPKAPVNAAVSDPCDGFVLARSGSRDAR